MNKQSKNILVINEGNSDNLGDQAINKSLEYIIKDCFSHNYHFEDLSRHKRVNCIYEVSVKDLKSPKLNVPKIYKSIKTLIYRLIWILRNINRINKAVKLNNYAIIGGGQLLLANNIFPFKVYVWTFFLKYHNVKYSFFSVGTQGNFSKYDRYFLKNALSGAEKIFVRDQLSKDLIKLNFNINSHLTYDVAFMYNKIDKIESCNEIDSILLGPVDIRVFKLYKEPYIESDDYHLLWLESIKNYDITKIKLFYSTNDDKLQCVKFKNFVEKKLNYKLDILENFNIDSFIRNIKKSKLVISGRMHSLILAKTFNVNYITFEVSDKLIEFNKIYQELNLTDIQTDLLKKIKTIL